MPNPENLIGKGFESRPQDINLKGRPRKSFRTINEAMKEKGVEPLTKSQMVEAYQLIFNSTAEELKIITKNPKTPIAFKLIVGELSKPSTRSKALADMRDYMFGKAVQNIDHTSKGESVNEHDFSQMTTEDLKAIDEIRSKYKK